MTGLIDPKVKRQLKKPEFWMTHLFIYFFMGFSLKYTDSTALMIWWLISYPIVVPAWFFFSLKWKKQKEKK
ncbi:hypothetical protein [Bacillus sp. FJAT-47783]|uniref:hypothetical protein n=1 Tax=Bacillus sp. FJAT-47783 TaxID=2922712 RepID=UPI001FABD014|nr:hypothetical protein [Bacillus sp. FJAT-47783]